MNLWTIALLIALGWVAFISLIHLFILRPLASGPGRDAYVGFLWLIVRAYARFMHKPRYENAGVLPANDDHGGLIIVSNHTGAVDPLLIQARCRALIRWMMASEMMSSSLDWVWRANPPIGVDRNGRDSGPLRQAIRCVKAGELVGIFPEGRIVQPSGEIRPFQEGVGLIVARCRVPVVLAWVSGTPATNKMGPGLLTRSNARVVFSDPIDYADEKDASVITQDLRVRLSIMSGWPLNDEPMPPAEEVVCSI